jgi:hypothetical protein
VSRSSAENPISLSLADRSISLGKSLRSFNRLPGRFPRSIIDANRVALLMRSGKLVKLPRASASRTASISSRGGLRIAENRLNPPGLGVLSGAGPPGVRELAALYAPSIASAFLSSDFWDDVGDSFFVAIVLGCSSGEESDASIRPVPLAKGELAFPIIGQTVPRCPPGEEIAMPRLAAPAPLLELPFATCLACCGIGF